MSKTIIEAIHPSLICSKDEPEYIIEINRHHPNPAMETGIENIKMYKKEHPNATNPYITYRFSGFDIQYLTNARNEITTGKKMKRIYEQHPKTFQGWQLDNDGFVMYIKVKQADDEKYAQVLNQFYDYYLK